MAADTVPDNQTRLLYDLAGAVVLQGAPVVNGWCAGKGAQPGDRCSFATGGAILRLNRRRETV